MYDVLIRGGRMVDGTGAPAVVADVAIEGNQIAAIGDLSEVDARAIVDASGCVVCPGFIDMHSHADWQLPLIPTADSLVRQGITTVVAGQCGGTPVPLVPETREQFVERRKTDEALLPWGRWSTFASYIGYMRSMGTSINMVELVGQGTIRAAVMGYSGAAPSPTELGRMRDLVAQAMDEGALGLSSGLIYAPGSYADTPELIALAQVVGERKGYYFSHIRGEGPTLLDAVSEAISIGRESGAAVQISHFKAMGAEHWDKAAQALELIDQARAEGLDVSADMYPYLAGSSGLSSLLPLWAHEGGKEATLARLADPATRQKMAEEMASKGFFRTARWDQVLICDSAIDRNYQGRYVSELAQAEGVSPIDWVFDALRESGLGIGMIHFYGLEDNLIMQLKHPAMMIGTDAGARSHVGPLSKGLPHPRHYGTYPKVLSHFVRDRAALSLEQAVHKMTGMVADKLRWEDRGTIQPGNAADLVVFRPETVRDTATYPQPHQYPIGIEHVLVNGTQVVRDGVHTGALPGQVITPL